MSDFDDLFGEWAVDAAGDPYTVTVTPPAGQGAWGVARAVPVQVQCPVFTGQRLVRASDGNERMSTATLYVGAETPGYAAVVPHATVSINGGPAQTIIRVDEPSTAGLFAFKVASCE